MPNNKSAGKVRGEKHLRFRCNGCGSCCSLWVPVTDEDVRRIREHTALPAERIVQFVASSRIEADRGTIVWIRFGPKQTDKKAMCLRERRGRCCFLKANKCMIYASRPVVCREHPFVLTLDESGRRITSIRMSTASKCSHASDGRILKRDLKKMYRWSLAQDESYRGRVKRWNRRKKPGCEKDFLRFVGLC